ncbi:MAG: CBS domain-containing protein [Nitrospira sp.]|nr:CBS domain-containing protein [Nitrospira sp.]
MNSPALSQSPGFSAAVHTAPPEVSVYDAARIMHWRTVGAVVVVRRHRAVGIVTDRDLATRVVANGLDPRATTLGRIMTAPLVTAPIDASDEQLLSALAQSRVRQIPLIDGEGNMAGLAAWNVTETGDGSGSFGARLVRSTAMIPMVKRRTFRRALYGALQEVRQHARWIGATVALAAVGAIISLIAVGYWSPWRSTPVASLHLNESSRSSKPSPVAQPSLQPDQKPAPLPVTPAR